MDERNAGINCKEISNIEVGAYPLSGLNGFLQQPEQLSYTLTPIKIIKFE